MLQAKPAMLSADGRINESLIATNAAVFGLCCSFGILDAEIALTMHQWKPKRLKLEVSRWAAGGNGAPTRPARCGHSGLDLRDLLEAHLMQVMRSCRIDFGGLNESLQQEVVRRVAGTRGAAAELQPAFLDTASAGPALVAGNRRLVSEHYSPTAYGERLRTLYADLLCERGDLSYVPATAVLRQFLQPERFRLLRME